jgi:hypothetical protein
MRSQRNGKDNTKMKYCPLVAGRRLTTGPILNNLKLEDKCSHQRQLKISAKE